MGSAAATAMNPFDFFPQSYETEALKTLGVWSQFREEELGFRPEPRARSPREQMVHQCASEEAWMRGMLGIDVGLPALPASETRLAFLEHYGTAAGLRLAALRAQDPAWWQAETVFFDVRRSRAWIFLRRIAHSAHHRGQLTVYLRLLAKPLYSTYGPTADTGGLAANGARVVYRGASRADLLAAESPRPLPGPGPQPVTERPD
jgi:uncharacterized damage-inducible protein DinB